jgi:hypothetical protein
VPKTDVVPPSFVTPTLGPSANDGLSSGAETEGPITSSTETDTRSSPTGALPSLDTLVVAEEQQSSCSTGVSPDAEIMLVFMKMNKRQERSRVLVYSTINPLRGDEICIGLVENSVKLQSPLDDDFY